MNTLSDGITTITLDDALFWTDRHSWQPVEQMVDRSITGDLLVDGGALHYGQPVTLAGERSDLGWMRLADLQVCRTWAAQFGKVLTLVWLGQAYSVAWRHQDRAIEARPLFALNTEDPDDEYVVTLRLMTVPTP